MSENKLRIQPLVSTCFRFYWSSLAVGVVFWRACQLNLTSTVNYSVCLHRDLFSHTQRQLQLYS